MLALRQPQPRTQRRAHGGDSSDAFHVVLPSIPGFGFSGPTRETGWEYRRIAAAFAELMRRLGYRRYGAQGGDWGAAISRELGRTRPDEIIGVHLTLIPDTAARRAEPRRTGRAHPCRTRTHGLLATHPGMGP